VETATVGQQTRVLVVEDHRLFLDFVSSTLRQYPNLQVIGEVQDGLEAVDCAEALEPDLILLDVGLPGLNGIDAAHRIRELVPDARIVFVTQESSPEVVREALNLGAAGYVTKTKAGKDLPLAVEAAIQGRMFVSAGLDGHAGA
jgi:two-component system, NarL family, nitrate/nitrite response regulator NarL